MSKGSPPPLLDETPLGSPHFVVVPLLHERVGVPILLSLILAMAYRSSRHGAGEARYNILVRGDSTSSAVMVNAAFKSAGLESYRWCVSTGRFEQMVGERIRARVQDGR